MDDLMITQAMEQTALPIGPQQLLEFTKILEKYNSGRKKTADRILSAENWWKLRNTQEASKETQAGKDGQFASQSGWLHNVITSKHADAMDAYPVATFLPREEGDQEEAKKLSQIVPCVLEQNGFEETYSDAMWQKGKTGTGVYKIVWDPKKLGGLGDISISCVNLLNLYWQPEIRDIQKSRYFFHTELMDRDLLEQQYPQVKDRAKGTQIAQAKFLGDEHDPDDPNRITVIEVYYHKVVDGRNTLQYCKYAGDVVLFATENEVDAKVDEMGQVISEPMAVTGLYDHCRYPYVFDPLFPVEGSPCGYGYVDVCRNPQITIDILKTSMVRNAAVGATPRYFSRLDGNIKESEFLDLSQPIVHVSGNLDDATLRPIDYVPLPGSYLNVLQDTVQELRETTGNTETSTGTPNSGVTAAAAIAALQEASGKGSRDASRGSYRAYSRLISMCVELIRQFYDLPRQFRIIGETGAAEYVSYTNDGLQPMEMQDANGLPSGYRLPVFDIKIEIQKKNAYTSMAQNELAIQLYQLGIFEADRAEASLMCLDMMDFEGKDKVIRKVADNAKIKDKLFQYLQLVMQMIPDPEIQMMAMQDMQDIYGMGVGQPMPGAAPMTQQMGKAQEPAYTSRVRQQTAQAAQP